MMLPMASTTDWKTRAVICLVSAISLAMISKLFFFLDVLVVVCSALISSSEVYSILKRVISHAFGCQTHSLNLHLVFEVHFFTSLLIRPNRPKRIVFILFYFALPRSRYRSNA